MFAKLNLCWPSLTQFQSRWQIKSYTVTLIMTYFINIDIFKRDYACAIDIEALFSH